MLVLEDIVGFHKNHSTSASSELLVVEKTLITMMLNALPWKRTEFILSFLRFHPRTAFCTLLFTMMATPFILRDSYRVVDIRVLYKGI